MHDAACCFDCLTEDPFISRKVGSGKAPGVEQWIFDA